MEAGNTKENLIFGCSIANDWKRSKENDLEAAYNALVGAGITDATDERRSTAGNLEDDWSVGILRNDVT